MTNLSHQAIQTYAHKVIEHFELFEEHRSEALRRLVDTLGGTVELAPSILFPYKMLIHDVRNFTIYLPRVQGCSRDNLGIAQSLGHYYIDYLLPNRSEEAIFEHNSAKYSTRQANTFGVELLLPETVYHTAVSQYGSDPWILSDRLKVSSGMIEQRARQFDSAVSV